MTVLVTLSVPDADDAATLIAVAADSTALTVVHTTVEGHLPLPGGTVLRGRQERPWMVQSVVPNAAILTDLAGGDYPGGVDPPASRSDRLPHRDQRDYDRPPHRRPPH